MKHSKRTVGIVLLSLVLLTGIGLALTGGVWVDGTVTIDSEGGPTIEVVTDSSQLILDGPDAVGTTVIQHTDGTVTFESQGDTTARIQGSDIEGDYTTVSQVSTNNNELSISPGDKQTVRVSGGLTDVSFRSVDYTESDPTTDFTYSAGSEFAITIDEMPDSETPILAYDKGSNEVVSQSNVSDGSVTFTAMPAGTDRQIRVTQSNAPTVDNESASPAGGVLVDETPAELSIEVDDADILEGIVAGTEPVGDTLNVTFYDASDDSIIGSQTATERHETVTQEWDIQIGGEKSWYAVVEDDYGNTVQSDTFTFSAPGDIQIYDESSPETLIDDREVTLEIYNLANDQIFTETVENGTLPLEGFPNEDYVIRMSADGYYDRSVIIRGIFQQQRLYMLNETAEIALPTYLINDETGQFDPTDSRVFIERGLTIDNETRYHTIAAEQVGTDGFTEQVEQGVRYRIVVENQEGDIRTLGKYSADRDGDLVLTVDAISFEFGADDDVIQWSAEQEEINEGEWIVRFNYNDPEARTKSLDVVIHERFNESNELHNGSYMGPIETISVVEPLEEGQENKQWVVKASADRNPLYEWQLTVDRDGQILDIPMDPHFIYVLSGISIVLIGGLASLINAPSMGIATAGVASIYWYIGFLPPLVGAGVVLVGFAVPVLYVVGMRRGGGV